MKRLSHAACSHLRAAGDDQRTPATPRSSRPHRGALEQKTSGPRPRNAPSAGQPCAAPKQPRDQPKHRPRRTGLKAAPELPQPHVPQGSPIAVAALDEQVVLHVLLAAEGADDKAGAGRAVRVVVLPLAVEARGSCPALHAAHAPGERAERSAPAPRPPHAPPRIPRAPFALPSAFGHGLQRRVQAVGVVADVAVVAEQQPGRVGGFAAHLADDALHAAPTLQQHHLGDLRTAG